MSLKQLKTKQEKKKRSFKQAVGTLGASLLGNLLAGKRIIRAGSRDKKGKEIVRAGSRNKKGNRIVRAGNEKEWDF